MANIIQVLPEVIANQIAAGEVIQRPASVVKELLENAVDAGASNIMAVIKEAGKSQVQVIDDGCGMTAEDAITCFEAHATSKIQEIDDLHAIRTKGFRGEALSSIGSVAVVELKTKRVEDELGYRVVMDNSKVKEEEPIGCTDGTTITVKDLFFNVPARKNFLKSDAAEMRHIVEEFQRVALAHPGIAFSLRHNGTEIMHLEPGNLRQRIVSVFGNNYNQRLVPIEEDTDVVKVAGFIGKPEFARKTRGSGYLMVNDRFVKNNSLNHAVLSGYDGLLAEGSFPFYLLKVEVDPTRVDVNVHPTKQEVKFEEDKVVYTIVNAAVKRALAAHSVTPTIDFDQERGFQDLEGFSKQAPVSSPDGIPPVNTEDSTMPDSQTINDLATEFEQGTLTLPSELSEPEQEEIKPKDKLPFQVHDRFIFSPIKSGFILVDQQSAHERVLYEKYIKVIQEQKVVSQKQLFPQTITLPAPDASLLADLLEEITTLGFDIQEFGGDSFVVRGIPADIKPGATEQEMIESLLEQYKVYHTELKLDQREALARVMAKQAAVKKGQRIGIEEMTNLIDELFACEVPNVAPNGKLTFITFSVDDLAKQFDKS